MCGEIDMKIFGILNYFFYICEWLMGKICLFMGIKVRLDTVMARRKISLMELSERVGITPANLSIFKTGKGRAVRFSTLEALCHELHCQPGDILEYTEDE